MGAMGREGMEAPLPDAENPAEELCIIQYYKEGREEVGALYPVVENPAKVFRMGCVVENLVFGIWLPSPRVTQILRKEALQMFA
jgi:hypothetical protein